MTDSRRGLTFMLTSAVLFALMGALVKGVKVDAYVMVMARFAIGAAVCLAIFLTGRDRMRWTNWPWLLGRGIIGGYAVVLLYWSIQHIGLGKAQMISYTYVVISAVLAVPVLGEHLRPAQWGAVGVATVGTMLLCDLQTLAFQAADLVALLSAVCSAIAVICITRCRATDSSTNIFFSQSLFGAAIAACPTVAHWHTPTATEWGMLAAVGLTAAAGQLTMTYAYKHTGASQGSLLSLVTPVLSAVIGVAYFREHFSSGFVVGSSLVMAACAYMALNPVRMGAVKAAAEPEG